MSDRQFSVPFDNETRAMIDCFGDDEFTISVANRDILFEWSERFGPMPITRDGAQRDISHKNPFWRAVSLWDLQGQRTEGKKAIWHEPKKPVLKHLGGRNYLIIEHGEPGHDW